MGIEKLGLLPGSRILKSEEGIACGVEATYDLNLVKASPVMLDDWIKTAIKIEKYNRNKKLTKNQLLDFIYNDAVKNVLSACPGKTWEEIKAAYDE